MISAEQPEAPQLSAAGMEGAPANVDLIVNGAETDAGEGKVDSKPEVTFPIVCPGHSRPVVDVRFSNKTEDGVFLVSACHDKKPMVRWGDNGDWIGTFEGHKGAVWSACLNYDATRAATGSADFSAKLWNAITGEEMHTFEHRHIVKTVEFSLDGTKLLTGGLEKRMKIFDICHPERKELLDLDNSAVIRKASWLSDSSTIVCGCEDGYIRKWDARSGELIASLQVFNSGFRDLEVNNSLGKLIIAGQKSIKIYSTDSLQLVHEQELSFNVETASLHPGGERFVAGGSDLWAHEFSLKENGKEISCNRGHHGPIFCIRYSPESNIYASGSEDGTIRMWKSV